MKLVAISAAYGAGGSRVAPAVAERLEVPFVDRAIPLEVAERLEVSVNDAAAHDDQISGGWLERMLRGFVGGDAAMPNALPPEILTADDFRRHGGGPAPAGCDGRGVILGRGGAIVLRDDPRVLRIRLTGPVERRVQQAISVEGLDIGRRGAGSAPVHPPTANTRNSSTASIATTHRYITDWMLD